MLILLAEDSLGQLLRSIPAGAGPTWCARRPRAGCGEHPRGRGADTPGSVSRTRYSFAIRSPISRRVHNCPLRPTPQGR
ncbi:hypothetical protein FRZ02_02935 [Streptomyces albidoflavus]|uniref:Uncharacterized protein n=1 Tax=Streptomyces albidoflavus TaxID=1886 RepID=A0ABY3H0S2_9ACTN|nr:hypothetical protein FRZ02_02935 [Streptomyces albidoflavus]